MYQPVNVTAPTNRGAQIAQMAQSAAQNAVRRQRMRALFQKTAHTMQGGGQQGVSLAGMPNLLNVMRQAGRVQGNAHQAGMLASMLNGSVSTQQAPGGVGGNYGAYSGGVTNEGGGGFDFSSLPDPNDPRQSPGSTLQVNPGGTMNSATPSGPANKLDFGGLPAPAQQPGAQYVDNGSGGPAAPGYPAGASLLSGGASGTGGLIPLGSGLMYDPATDTVHGPGAVNNGVTGHGSQL